MEGGPPNDSGDNRIFLMLQQLAADYHRTVGEVRTRSTPSTQANPQDGDAPTTTSTTASTQASTQTLLQ